MTPRRKIQMHSTEWRLLISLTFLVMQALPGRAGAPPIVVSTWPFQDAVRAAWDAIQLGLSSVDAVVEGCSACEALQCDGSVGYGGSPDEIGETTLDAMIMDGVTMDVGAVGALRNIKDASRAAKLVLEYTEHSLLVGDQATMFALSLGLNGPSNLSTSSSLETWSSWMENGCQPNFWRNVNPASNASCGPYTRIEGLLSSCEECLTIKELRGRAIGVGNHDTISMAAIDKEGRVAAGTSTNGASYKIPGRVGDGPIIGAAAYADQEVGACGATGDGDVMMRFLPCYQVVESMRLGLTPAEATENAISRIRRKYPTFVGAVFAINMQGEHAGACHGWTFQYSVRSSDMEDVTVFTVYPAVTS